MKKDKAGKQTEHGQKEKAERDMAEKKEKVKQAIALSYDPGDDAPRVIASGKGALAERIIEKAKESEVPVHRDDKLADTLSRLEIGDMIPPELYEVVAEILVFVDAMDKIKAKMDMTK
jgi:flagellar biosynthesis protein